MADHDLTVGTGRAAAGRHRAAGAGGRSAAALVVREYALDRLASRDRVGGGGRAQVAGTACITDDAHERPTRFAHFRGRVRARDDGEGLGVAVFDLAVDIAREGEVLVDGCTRSILRQLDRAVLHVGDRARGGLARRDCNIRAGVARHGPARRNGFGNRVGARLKREILGIGARDRGQGERTDGPIAAEVERSVAADSVLDDRERARGDGNYVHNARHLNCVVTSRVCNVVGHRVIAKNRRVNGVHSDDFGRKVAINGIRRRRAFIRVRGVLVDRHLRCTRAGDDWSGGIGDRERTIHEAQVVVAIKRERALRDGVVAHRLAGRARDVPREGVGVREGTARNLVGESRVGIAEFLALIVGRHGDGAGRDGQGAVHVRDVVVAQAGADSVADDDRVRRTGNGRGCRLTCACERHTRDGIGGDESGLREFVAREGNDVTVHLGIVIGRDGQSDLAHRQRAVHEREGVVGGGERTGRHRDRVGAYGAGQRRGRVQVGGAREVAGVIAVLEAAVRSRESRVCLAVITRFVIGGHGQRSLRDREVVAHVRDRVVGTERERALGDGVRAHILARSAGERSGERVAVRGRARDDVGEGRVCLAVDLRLIIGGHRDRHGIHCEGAVRIRDRVVAETRADCGTWNNAVGADACSSRSTGAGERDARDGIGEDKTAGGEFRACERHRRAVRLAGAVGRDRERTGRCRRRRGHFGSSSVRAVASLVVIDDAGSRAAGHRHRAARNRAAAGGRNGHRKTGGCRCSDRKRAAVGSACRSCRRHCDRLAGQCDSVCNCDLNVVNGCSSGMARALVFCNQGNSEVRCIYLCWRPCCTPKVARTAIGSNTE